MQRKISSFFKPKTPNTPKPPIPPSDPVPDEPNPDLGVVVTYTRRNRNPPPDTTRDNNVSDGVQNSTSEISSGTVETSPHVLHRKRKYVQFCLELGQSDFLLHTCNMCGLSYAKGDKVDENIHKVFHTTYHQGIQFKGWKNERVIPMSEKDAERVILVVDSDPPAWKHKVQDVIKVMANDLCLADEWVLHKLCKTYLFICRNRIVACLVAEPINLAYRVLPNSSSSRSSGCNSVEAANTSSQTTESLNEKMSSKHPTCAVLQFGNITFHRETMRKCSSGADQTSTLDAGAIFTEEEAVPAVCGIRAIWVAPCQRRQRVATRLLDAARKIFITSSELALSQCAFSAPSSAGRAFASSYSKTKSFLVYKAEDSTQ